MSKHEPPISAEQVEVVKPDYTIKRKLGDDIDLSKILTEEGLKACQTVIDSRQKDFLEWIKEELAALETSYKQITRNVLKSVAYVTKLRNAAFTIKSQAGTFGFDLASSIARSLYNFCEKDFDYDERQLVVLRKHIDALNIVLSQRIAGAGGQMGRDLMTGLQALVMKFK